MAPEVPSKRAAKKARIGSTQLRWTPEMDSFLGAVLLEDVAARGRRGNNGMRSETVKLARDKVAEKFAPITVTTDNVRNRLKGLKREFNTARDAIHSSGFGVSWDGETKCVTADPASWELYVKAHPEAAGLRDKFFPLYEAMYEIYGHDDANGEAEFTAFETNVPPPATPVARVVLDDDEDVVPEQPAEGEVDGTPSTQSTQSTQAKTTQKRRREASGSYVDHEDVVSYNATLREATAAFKEASLMDAKSKAEKNAKPEVERIEMWSALRMVEGLTQDEQYSAAITFHREPNLLSGFLTTPEEFKLGYLRFLLKSPGN